MNRSFRGIPRHFMSIALAVPYFPDIDKGKKTADYIYKFDTPVFKPISSCKHIRGNLKLVAVYKLYVNDVGISWKLNSITLTQ